MSDILVIEWDRNRLIAGLGSARTRSIHISAATVIDREQGRLLPTEVGERLSGALQAAGISSAEAIVVFPRELVTFHRVQLPNLPEHEIPDIVQLQAATRLTVPVETVCLDFVPLPVAAGSHTRDVLLVTVPKKHVSDVREALKVCGVELAGVRVSSFGIAASAVHSGLLSSASASDAVEAVVWLSSDSIEMLMMTGHSVAFSHSGASWTTLDGVEQAVRAEVSRARMSASEDMGDYRVSRVTLIGSPEITARVPDSISKRLNDAEVLRVDPQTLFEGTLDDDVSPSDLLAVAGVIANYQATSVETVDLLHPRKAPEKKDYRRLKTILVGGTAALLLVGGWSWRTNRVNALRADVAAAEKERTRLEMAYKASENELRLYKDLQEWSDRDLNWLEEMEKITTLMESTDRVLIKRFRFSTRSGNYLAAVDANGFAKSRRDVEDLMRALADAGYEVPSQEITQSQRDPNYQTELRLEVRIPVRAPATDKKNS